MPIRDNAALGATSWGADGSQLSGAAMLPSATAQAANSSDVNTGIAAASGPGCDLNFNSNFASYDAEMEAYVERVAQEREEERERLLQERETADALVAEAGGLRSGRDAREAPAPSSLPKKVKVQRTVREMTEDEKNLEAHNKEIDKDKVRACSAWECACGVGVCMCACVSYTPQYTLQRVMS